MPPQRILEERDYVPRKGLGIVRGDEILAGCEPQTLGADRRRDDRFLHRQRFEDLQPRAASRPEWHHIDRRFCDIRPHIVDGPGDQNTGTLGERFDPRTRPPADDGE